MTRDIAGFEVGTFEGLRAAQQLDIAALSPTQRVEWLEAAVDVAMESGALTRARDQKQAEIDAVWARQ